MAAELEKPRSISRGGYQQISVNLPIEDVLELERRAAMERRRGGRGEVARNLICAVLRLQRAAAEQKKGASL